MEAEKQLKKTISRISCLRSGGGNMSFVDNRQQAVSLAKSVDSIQKIKGGNNLRTGITTFVLQRTTYNSADQTVVGRPLSPMEVAGTIRQDEEKGHTFYRIANYSSDCPRLYSNSYASCVGLSIFRPSQKRGMLAHFWAASTDMIGNFEIDFNDLLSKWGEILSEDVLTIWDGAAPTHKSAQDRITQFNALEKWFTNVNIRHFYLTGSAFLDLNTGLVSGDEEGSILGTEPKPRINDYQSGHSEKPDLLSHRLSIPQSTMKRTNSFDSKTKK